MPEAFPARVAVRGVGRVVRPPDVADLTLVFEATRPTATEARDIGATTAARVIAAVKGAGVGNADIRTAGIDLQPAWEHDDRGRASRIGFTITHRIAARVRDLDAVGRILDAGLDAGATGVDAVTLGIADATAAETDARALAVADARQRAETIARAAGTSLGRLISLSEGVTLPPPNPRGFKEMRFAMAADASTPVEAGTLEVSVAIEATWELAGG
ncbi:MAG TPA: SIMPL domain-containing protein [Candidatus Limnocylindrales bacterium]|nr:SIMPL domain-containing protein [Candidatus Limnocylindrales bacterium]